MASLMATAAAGIGLPGERRQTWQRKEGHGRVVLGSSMMEAGSGRNGQCLLVPAYCLVPSHPLLQQRRENGQCGQKGGGKGRRTRSVHVEAASTAASERERAEALVPDILFKDEVETTTVWEVNGLAMERQEVASQTGDVLATASAAGEGRDEATLEYEMAKRFGAGSAHAKAIRKRGNGRGRAAEELSRIVEKRMAEVAAAAAAALASKGDGGGGGGVVREHELTNVPGIGPRNRALLMAQGLHSVHDLQRIFSEMDSDKDKMVNFLRDTCLIRHKGHANSIVSFLAQSGEPRLTFCVEGNISVGKSTFLNRVMEDALELREFVDIVPEPVAEWQNVGGRGHNVLEAFYKDPSRYAYTFQHYVFCTRVLQARRTTSGVRPMRLIERSVFSDRMVFVRAVHEAKWMSDMEISIYDSWFDPMISALPGLVPDGFIYLRANPDVCYNRLKGRARSEETAVSLEYLQGLHAKHESWLLPVESEPVGLKVEPFSAFANGGSTSFLVMPPVPDIIRDNVVFLQNNVHEKIQRTPTLVLDCNGHMDLNGNSTAGASQLQAQQLMAFHQFVKQQRVQHQSKVQLKREALLQVASKTEEYARLMRQLVQTR